MSRRPPLHLLVLALLVGSCIRSDIPTGVEELTVHIPINPALIPSPADAGAAPITRIRAQALRAADNAVLGETVVEVVPTDDEWVVDLGVAVNQPTVDVVVSVFLMSGTAEQPTVEFSGQVGPLTVSRGSPLEVADIPIVRGPIGNLFVTGVSVTSTPDTLLEGTSGPLEAEATSSSPTLVPQVYWTSLDSAVLSTTGSTVTGVAPGTGRVVASAGTHSDTASIVVRPAPASIIVVPASDTATAVGQQIQYQAFVVDARGDTLTQEQVTWRSATPQIISSLGAGLFEALAPGDGTVEAASVTLPSVVGSAELIVLGQTQPNNVDIRILKTVDDSQPLGGATVTFTVSAVNEGPIDATNLAVFDTLAGVFLSPSHSVTTGALVGDSLWTIPALAVDDTARWTTTATVAPDVAGSSTSNRAILRSLAQNDTTPANDSVTVAINFPLSAVPVVTIATPADGSVFDPGDPVTFTGTATDAEDGDLTTQIQWESDVDGPLGTGRSVSTSTLTTGIHRVSATVTDQTGGVGADTVQVTIALITTPATLNVPFGGTASLPISLSEPAQAGGLTLTVASNDPSITSPTAPTVFIAGGALSANATLDGIALGTTDVTVSHPQFGSATTSVSVTAALNIVPTAINVPQTLPQTVDVRLESQGSPIAAPPGGLALTYSSSDPGCLTVPASGSIAAGLVSTTAALSWGGVTQTPCSSWFRVSAGSVVADSVNVAVTATPTISLSGTTVGAGLQYGNFNVGLSTALHSGLTVRLESTNPQVLLVSPNSSTAGTAFIDVFIPSGQNNGSYYVQGVEGVTGAPQLRATAPGFVEDTATVTVVQPGFDIQGVNQAATLFAGDDPFEVRVGVPNGQLTGLQLVQSVRIGGSPFTATVTTDDASVLDLVTLPDSTPPVTVTIAPGSSNSPGSVANGGVAAQAVAAGNATVTATIPGLLATAAATRAVTVTAPVLSVSPTTVGAGLQYGSFTVVLGATQHGGATVRVESTDPQILLVSPNASTAGTPFIDLPTVNGQNTVNYYVHGVEGAAGTPQVRATAPGFVEDTATVTVVQAAYEVAGLNQSTTTFSPDDPFEVRVGVANGQLTGLSLIQAVRIGGTPLTATITSSDPSVGDLVTLPDSASPVTVEIAPGSAASPNVANGGVAFDPVSGGSTTVTANIPNLLATTGAARPVTVSAPLLSVGGTTVGAGLQYGNFNVGLGATQHNGATVRIESTDPQVLLVSPDANTAGTAFIDVLVPDGSSLASYFVQGVEGATGTPQIRVTAPGFVADSATVTVVQPAYDIVSLNQSLTTFSPDEPFQVRLGVPNSQLTALQLVQAVRIGGQAVDVTLTSSNTGVGILETSTTSGGTVGLTIPPGAMTTPTSVAAGGVAFDPLGNGTSTVTALVSNTGFVQTNAAVQPVNVTAPSITVGSTTVGQGLEYGNFSVVLGAAQHGGVDVRIESSNPSVFLVSPNATTAGTPFIVINVPNGQTSATYWVHGLEGATGTAALEVSAPGFTDATGATVTVVEPSFDIVALSTTNSVGAGNDAFQVRLGVPNANGSGLAAAQWRRFGATPLSVTITTSDPTVAQLTNGTSTGASFVLEIAGGEMTTPIAVPPGVALDPVSVGTTSVSASIPGFVPVNTGTQTVTINP